MTPSSTQHQIRHHRMTFEGFLLCFWAVGGTELLAWQAGFCRAEKAGGCEDEDKVWQSTTPDTAHVMRRARFRQRI